MKKNIARNCVNKTVVAMFCLVMLVYGQCGYAVIEKYLTPVEGIFYELGNKDSPVKIETVELAEEIAIYLQGRLLRTAHIGCWYDISPRIILDVLIQTLHNNATLNMLDLRHNNLYYEDVDAIANALIHNSTLFWFELHNNGISDEGTVMLAEALQSNVILSTLILECNDIGNAGAKALSEVLQYNTALTTLSLKSNNIEYEGAKAIAEALRYNTVLTTLNLEANYIGNEGVQAIHEALIDNYTILVFKHSFGTEENEKILLRNRLLLKLLHKVKRASAFTFKIGFGRTPIRDILSNILGFAGLDVYDRPVFGNVQHYNNEGIRDTIFRGCLENIIRLFYNGNNADYREIVREVNQIRRLQIEIFREHHRDIPDGLLLELPEYLPQPRNLAATAFWAS